MSRAKPKKATKKKTRGPAMIELAAIEYPLQKDGGLRWEGHLLNPKQVETFKRKVDERLAIANSPGSRIKHAGIYARNVGFDDLLAVYRPSGSAKDELNSVSMALSSVAVTIGTLRDFAFNHRGAAQEQGAALVQKLAEEASGHVAALLHLAESIRLEGSTKLEHWTARWAEYDCLNRA